MPPCGGSNSSTRGSAHLAAQPGLIHISLSQQFILGQVKQCSTLGIVVDNTTEFRHNDNLVSREVVGLDCFPEDDLRETVAVHVGRVKRVDAEIIRKLDLLDP